MKDFDRACSELPESRRAEQKKQSLPIVNEHFSATSNAESGDSGQALGSDGDTIVALASGSAPGAIAVIRISGPNCWKKISHLFTPTNPTNPNARMTNLRSMICPDTKQVIDELITVFFLGPNSFTGEDSLELYCHGGPFIIQKILSVVRSCGIRSAFPGEFTKRALLNGKIDLIEAEGIKALVEAQTEQQWKSGRQLFSGRLSLHIEKLRSSLIEAMAWLEAMIDFPDEGDTQSVHLDHVQERVRIVSQDIRTLLSSFQSGQIAAHGLSVVLAGAPNAGKSSLFNALLGKNRAIVSSIAGTTRDYIEERCLVEGRLIRLIDVAGLRDSTDEIEAEGIKLSKELIKSADIVILLLPASDSKDSHNEILEKFRYINGDGFIPVVTKIDLGVPDWMPKRQLGVTCKTANGLDDFKQLLAQTVDLHMNRLGEDVFLTTQRQKDCLVLAKAGIEKFFIDLNDKKGHELLAFELQEVSRSLAAVIGSLSNEDILDKVFSDFCIGK
ncbi:MAG: tRNA uridine-5-carboxymethylaminomethyl(34) synthesis GTPase MnmE [Proteobacteria bacterium]|nr:tRNA uridine-5-carboxymethylaminomethyl(34) synthesis GTPase MnmE [Pseudomonadota bacterium]